MTQTVPGGWQNGVARLPTVSIVITTYTLERWDYLRQAIASVQAQTIPAIDTIVVVDHNPALLERARAELRGVTVIPNQEAPGSSGARNSGAAVSDGKVLAFFDDDIVASSVWLEAVLPHFERPEVVGVGGRAEPMWEGSSPGWFPPEFYWVVGACYLGMPESVRMVRNVWSSNMAIRRNVFEAIGGFRLDLGKVKGRPRPEDTDLCLRAATAWNQGIWIYEPEGLAHHQVPPQRTKVSYFLYRCFHEGSGKAALAALNGLRESTALERRYMRSVLPFGIVRGLQKAARGDAWAGLRSLAIIFGSCAAIAGFLVAEATAMAQVPAARRYQIGARRKGSGRAQGTLPGHTEQPSGRVPAKSADPRQKGMQAE